MIEQYVVADVGATNMRVGVYDRAGHNEGYVVQGTDPADYYGTIKALAAGVRRITGGNQVTASAVAIATELNAGGQIVGGGSLNKWAGNWPGLDIAAELDLPPQLSGVLNDTEAIGVSQLEINRANGREARGSGLTLSSGWGGATYSPDGTVVNDEPGHYLLREGATCPCGKDGCAEAYISGNGVKINHGLDMQTWLETDPAAPTQLVTDISTAVIDMITRHRDHGFRDEEVRWTGSVAIRQPMIMGRAAEKVRKELPGGHAPAFDMVTLGHQAGVHGAFIKARSLADAY